MMKNHCVLAVILLGLMYSSTAWSQTTNPRPAQPRPAANKPKPPKEIAPAVQIYFDFNKSTLKKAEIEKLEKLLEDLKSKSEYKMMLTGHTDSTGNDDYNMQLSQRRVDEVYDWLMERDIDTSVVGRVYFGRSKPREKNEGDEEKKAKNRRVEITIIEKPAPPPPPPPPPPKDTCVKDTTVFIGQGVSITLNRCDYFRMCRNSNACVSIDRKSDLEEIFESGTPLKTQKGDGFNWAGIYNIKMAGDTCLKKPASFSVSLDLETYKKAKLSVYKPKGEDYLEQDKSVRVNMAKTKDNIKVTLPLKCPGQINLCGVTGKSKVAAFKDKSSKIKDIYVVTYEPPTIIPATKKGSKWYVNYGNIQDGKLFLVLNDGETVVKDVDLNGIRKTKTQGVLRKKYKIKAKHIKR
ncbi:MAG: OmpA family protein [Sphingomonadales bacterium]|nr:OmpA family protein [Sphingomonadales bacterium]